LPEWVAADFLMGSTLHWAYHVEFQRSPQLSLLTFWRS
jgi:hypothetical protein